MSRSYSAQYSSGPNDYEIVDGVLNIFAIYHGVSYTILADESDIDILLPHHWWLNFQGRKNPYAWSRNLETGKVFKMHRLIMGLDGPRVDHQDLNPLNNQRSNLRHATNGQNVMNTGLTARNKSGCKGVSWNKAGGKWVATIKFQGKCFHLGYFESVEMAASAYDKAAIEMFGSFARTNEMIKMLEGTA
jgi:hypothetical protein